jgi:hypothetical protein
MRGLAHRTASEAVINMLALEPKPPQRPEGVWLRAVLTGAPAQQNAPAIDGPAALALVTPAAQVTNDGVLRRRTDRWRSLRRIVSYEAEAASQRPSTTNSVRAPSLCCLGIRDLS